MTGLPVSIRQAAQELAAQGGDLRASAGRMSAHYRARGTSREVIGGEADAAAYALSRMPATFAAVTAVLEELGRRAPEFAPASLLDVGAGPGTAAWAAAETFPGIDATLVDHNPSFLRLAERLGQHSAAGSVATLSGDLQRLDAGRAPLVLCAYALTELADAPLIGAAERLWAATDGALVIVEPGRPRDYERLLRVRGYLVGKGAELLAPCPHADDCPLREPDWCHFSVRLERSREHMHLKGGSLGYEDEKYSYLILVRPGIGRPAQARVLRRPEENKFSVTLSLCTPGGLATQVVASRDKPAFRTARKLQWGDPVGD